MRTAAVVTLLAGLAGCAMLILLAVDVDDAAQTVVILFGVVTGPLLILPWGLVIVGLVPPGAFLLCGVLMLRGSRAAAVVTVLLGAANALMLSTLLMDGRIPSAPLMGGLGVGGLALLAAFLATWAALRPRPVSRPADG